MPNIFMPHHTSTSFLVAILMQKKTNYIDQESCFTLTKIKYATFLFSWEIAIPIRYNIPIWLPIDAYRWTGNPCCRTPKPQGCHPLRNLPKTLKLTPMKCKMHWSAYKITWITLNDVLVRRNRHVTEIYLLGIGYIDLTTFLSGHSLFFFDFFLFL